MNAPSREFHVRPADVAHHRREDRSVATDPERVQAHVADVQAISLAEQSFERVTVPDSPLPLYTIEDRRPSGEWIVIGQVCDPLVAQELAAILRSVGADIRVELIATPNTPV